MLNKYPAWKNILILFVVALGLLYSAPNLFPDDPAIQVSHTTDFLNVSDLEVITTALEAGQIDFFGATVDENNALVRLSNLDDQLRAKTVIEDALNDQYIIALNLAPTTPAWMQSIGAGKMNLGLDLQGGVHFLMEVDMDAAIERRMEDNVSNIRNTLRTARIRTSGGIEQPSMTHIQIGFSDEDTRSLARSELRDVFPELLFQNGDERGQPVLDLRLLDETVLQIQEDTLQTNRITLLSRVDVLGVAEPTVQRQGANRIVVELPGIQDPAQAIRQLQRIATLEFHLQAAVGASPLSFETYTSTDGIPVNVDNDVIMQGDRVSAVQPALDENGLPQVSINLDAQGGQQINRVTRDNVGRNMSILLNETKSRTITVLDENEQEVNEVEFYEEARLISNATIQTALGRQFRITGLSQREANDLSDLIKSGALAAPMTIVEQSVIGPTMGRENLDQGILAVQLASALVILFMLFYYRVFGIAANLALIVNILLIFAVMSSVIPATLTLPGIFGIVLTVGMAVDANVLIFTRIREELADGMSPQQAIDAGYDRAFSTILDANLTTFLVAVVLFTIGTGPVKGFSVTLMIGIMTSMFTAIVGTRALVNLIYGGRSVQTLSIGGQKPITDS